MRAWPDTTFYCLLAQPLSLATGWRRELFERGADISAPKAWVGASRMRIEPAIPWTFPRAAPRDRALRWLAAVTLIVASAAVLGAAMTAVILGIT
jgi:hypothetical protein